MASASCGSEPATDLHCPAEDTKSRSHTSSRRVSLCSLDCMAPADPKHQYGSIENQDCARSGAIAAQLIGSTSTAASSEGARSDTDIAASRDALVQEIIIGAHPDDAQFRTFAALAHNIALPADAFVIGEPVSVVQIDYGGNPRRGLTARCRRDDGSHHVVALCDVLFPQTSTGALYVAGYQKWLGLEARAGMELATPPRARHKAAADDIDLAEPVDLIVLAVKQSAARCRILDREREITLRSTRTYTLVPGEIATVRGRKQWRHAGHPYLSGDIIGHRFDVAALGLVPLRIENQGLWEPADHYWGEEDELIEDWAKPIIARGPRPSFEMERVLPGEDPDDWVSDPILQAIDLHDSGDPRGAAGILMKMLAADLRCLDAHAHLGNFLFDRRPADAIRHYEVGVRIGELSLGRHFEDVLLWGHIDNRPFLRCLQGYGLCLWRLGRVDEAAALFERMLWLNPADNQGVRFLLPDIRAGKRWEDCRNG